MDTRLRLGVGTLLCLLPVLPLASRLAWLQVVRHEQLESKARGETAGRDLVIVPRGRILDREGRVLAESLPAASSFLDLTNVDNPRQAVGKACRALGMAPAQVMAKLKPGRRFLWLKRKMTPEDVLGLKARIRQDSLGFVGFVADQRRAYPNGDMLRGVLGDVNIDENGLSGIELAYDRELIGHSYSIRLMKDRRGDVIASEPRREQPAPPDMRLSIDRTAQHFAESELRRAVIERKAKRGFVLVQDPRNGEILAMTSYPPEALKNPAVQEVYEPGSTFKLVAAAAALERRLYGPQDTIDCERGHWAITPSVTIKDHEPEGRLTLQQAVERSSNIGMAKVSLRLGAPAFHKMCRLFGFGYRTGIPLPGESSGILPPLSEFSAVKLANAGFGQGIAVTPLQLSAAYSAIANSGTLLEPRLVLSIGDKAFPGPVRLRQVVAPQAAAELGRMLEGVVLRGTGQTARVPGYRVAGKTGTAQKADPATGRYSAADYVSSFVGYVPADAPRLTILVVVDSPRVGYYGSEVAGPVFSRLARELLAHYGIAPEAPPAPGAGAVVSSHALGAPAPAGA